MPNFSGNWKMIKSENFEDLLLELGKEVFELLGGERDTEIFRGGKVRTRKKKRSKLGCGSLHPPKKSQAGHLGP
jgi:hypothetical protein